MDSIKLLTVILTIVLGIMVMLLIILGFVYLSSKMKKTEERNLEKLRKNLNAETKCENYKKNK